jgi:hypothetical protein
MSGGYSVSRLIYDLGTQVVCWTQIKQLHINMQYV